MPRPPIRRFLRLPRSAERIRADVDAELAFDIEMRARDYTADGMDADVARERAVREFGDLDATRRYCEATDMDIEADIRRSHLIDDLRADMRIAWRAMQRTPAFAAVRRTRTLRAAGAGSSLPTIHGRQPTTTPMSRSDDKLELLQGTLDMLILKTLLFGPAHGHGIATSIRQSTGDVLVVEHGSLYPALHRLQRDGFIAAKWETAAGKTREHKYYRLTAAGRRQLARQESKWNALVRAIGSVMQPAPER